MPLRIATLFLALFLMGCGDKKEVTGAACGGVTATQCPAGQHCVDDPKDTCDPNTYGQDKAGADCPRICASG
ncbi:MAG: hypothetical protein M3495_15565 [Pseudomonadota bacterium]|nr:hypothetical protein [Gammaproteobacteria bacterium]MDQ3582922.1 hypothetical protein [Pseudomonadota bacterium]